MSPFWWLKFSIGQIQQFSEDECVPIQGPCSNGAAPEFFINEQLTLWPYPGTQQYNVTYSSGTYKFCFINITEHVVLSEYCYQHHSADCSLCSIQSGEIVFRSRSEIALPRPRTYIHCKVSHICHYKTQDPNNITLYVGHRVYFHAL